MAVPDWNTPIRTGAQAVALLEGLIRPDFRPYAERAPLALRSVRRLLGRVGDPHLGLPVLHVAGSKGKGSTALLAEAVLEAGGRRTGTFTSPHLERWTERFRVHGREVDGARLAALLERLRPHLAALTAAHPADPPSFFDAATAAALLLFREEGVDCALVEVGIGGRLDPTSVVQPRVSCITGIELEHVDKLGDDLAAIAAEKAGIIRPGVPVVVAAVPPAAGAVIEARAAELGAPLLREGRELEVEISPHAHGSRLRLALAGLRLETELSLPGPHLARDAAIALACVARSGLLRPEDLPAAAARGLAAARLPGRCEILAREPLLIVDGAHTEASARALASMLATLPAARRHLLLSVSAEKRLDGLCAALLPGTHACTVTCALPLRSMPAEALAAALRARAPALPLHVEPDPRRAVHAALARLATGDLLCATGSVYMAGVARTALLSGAAAGGAETATPRAGAPGGVPDRELP